MAPFTHHPTAVSDISPQVSTRRPKRVPVRIRGGTGPTTDPERRDHPLDVLCSDGGRIVPDPSGVTFFSATGFSLPAAARARTGALGVDLRSATLSTRVHTFLEITGTQYLPPVNTKTREALVDDSR